MADTKLSTNASPRLKTPSYTRRRISHQSGAAHAPVAKNVWHTLRAEFAGEKLKVTFNGKTYIEQEDSHIPGPGAVGVWTKADSITAFDDFTFGSL